MSRNDVKGTIIDMVNECPKKWFTSREIEHITGFWRQSINCAIRSLENDNIIKVKMIEEKSYEMNCIKKYDE